MYSHPPLPIYIPLCFYFIMRRTDMQELEKIHLHSTMLPLYRNYFAPCMYLIRIYIPLCFYFIVFIQPTPITTPKIYIPLCFYFIDEMPEEAERILLFTFHYASTLSDYGTCKYSRRRKHLHSTMLLLYLFPPT